VEYGLALARRSLEAFSPEETTRVAKTALEFLEDKGWRGDRSLQGEARLLLARALQMTASLDGALREAEAAAKVFEKEKRPERAIAAMLTAAEVAWQGRRLDETRRWVDRGIEAAVEAEGTSTSRGCSRSRSPWRTCAANTRRRPCTRPSSTGSRRRRRSEPTRSSPEVAWSWR